MHSLAAARRTQRKERSPENERSPEKVRSPEKERSLTTASRVRRKGLNLATFGMACRKVEPGGSKKERVSRRREEAAEA